MKNFMLFLVLFISYQLSAQTKLIAYKSHSGDLDFFIPDAQPEDDYGLPPQRIIKIEKLNDSTVVETTDHYVGEVVTDTVVNLPYFSNPNLKLDEIKARYYRSDIKFVGFDKKTAKASRKEKKAAKKKLEERNKVPPKILKKDHGRIKPACEPKKDSSQTMRERAVIPAIGNFQGPSGGASSSGISWTLIFSLCFLYLASLGYLVYHRQKTAFNMHK